MSKVGEQTRLVQIQGESTGDYNTMQEEGDFPFGRSTDQQQPLFHTPTSSMKSNEVRGRSDTQHSVTSFGIMDTEASPKDIQELLDNLDRATTLIRRHMESQNDTEEHV